VVDEAALIEAVRTGTIAGAGIDVFENLPLPPESPLWDLENVFITPHIGGQSDQYEENLMSILKPNLQAFIAGQDKKMINVVPLA
jgi:phosphoglycerate dehydrogenase-like enzyme